MKVHFEKENGKTLCGKKPKPIKLLDPFLEITKEGFLNWSNDVRCKICEKKINSL